MSLEVSAELLLRLQGDHLEAVQNPWSLSEFQKTLAQPQSRIFFWPHKKKPEGFILCFENFKDAHNLEIEILHLAVEVKNQGNGFRMFEKFLADTKTQAKETVVFLDVNPKNLSALKLYKKLGFLQVGVRQKYYKTGDDAWLMKFLVK